MPLSVDFCNASSTSTSTYIYTLNRHKFDYYSTGITPGGNARKDEIKENIGRKNVQAK